MSQVEPQEGVEVLHKARVKLMAMGENKKWADKGSGMLSLRRATGEEDAGKLPYLVFTTDAGEPDFLRAAFCCCCCCSAKELEAVRVFAAPPVPQLWH